MSDTSSLTAFRCGILHAIGGFDANDLSGEERAGIIEKKSWFWLGEVVMAAMMAATIAVPAGMHFTDRTSAPLAIIGAVVIFLPLFIFIPKLIRQAVQVSTEAVIATLGKNEQTRRVFWALFLATAGFVLAQVVDPATAQGIISAITGIGM